MLLRIYAKCPDGQDEIAMRRIMDAFTHMSERDGATKPQA